MGSCATSAVTPAVAPTVDAISWRITHDEGASSVKEQVLQANNSLFSLRSSRGNSRLEHSEQKRKRIGSFPPFAPLALICAGDDMVMRMQVMSQC